MPKLTLEALRRKHEQLQYRGYTSQQYGQDLLLEFDLRLSPSVHFRPQLTWQNLPKAIWQRLEDPSTRAVIERLFYHIGLAELPSYWKAACPPLLELHTPTSHLQLDAAALDWWRELFVKGLGEFYYHNQIDYRPADFLRLRTTGVSSAAATDAAMSSDASYPPISSEVLVPVGGGKDSATVLALLEEAGRPYDILLLSPHSPAAAHIATLMQEQGHCQQVITLQRRIDPQLLALNQQGYLNGHTPFSAYLAFVSVAVAYLFGHREILLGNEASADEANLRYLGQDINHQYSKSSAFEAQFQDYVSSQLLPAQARRPHYHSRLRNLSELEITAQLTAVAARDPRFATVLRTLRSCNVGQQKGIWCHNCPKCAFVYTMFAAHLPPQVVNQEIFHRELFEQEGLLDTFADLAGLGDKKPFECVGTFAEMRQALRLAQHNYQQHHVPVPELLFALNQRINKAEFSERYREQKILLLGMGREGLATLAFLRQLWPDKTIGIADANEKCVAELTDPHLNLQLGPTYLDHLTDYDLVIQTAGISPYLPAIQAAKERGVRFTSATELFFDFCPSAHIIGITGTKGKSTTSQLIHQILQQAGRPAVLLGNIGEAALGHLSEIDTRTQVVFELSCHQLASLRKSPHIAVVLDVLPEHLDYYPDFDAYLTAKSHIASHQQSSDYLIYNPALAGASRIAKLSPAQKITHSLSGQNADLTLRDGQIIAGTEPLLAASEVPLLGAHNLYNVLPAIAVAQLLNIPRAAITTAIKNFRPLPHRLELVRSHNKVRYIDDSIAVNPHATIMALRSFPAGSVILLAGGFDRQQDFQELAAEIVKRQVKAVIAMPVTGQRLLDELQAIKAPVVTTAVADLEAGVARAAALAGAGDVVLLSPASASFNDFTDYAARGAHFRELVKQL